MSTIARRSVWQALVGALLAATAMSAAAVGVLGVRVHEAPEYTRVVFDITSKVRYELFSMDGPTRVVVDLTDGLPDSGFSVPTATGTLLTGIRHARREGGYRVVLDVAEPVEPSGFTLRPISPYGHRLVIDLYKKSVVDKSKAPQQPGLAPQPRPKERDILIAIDAGHGGEDPGAVGVGKVLEADVVYEIAKLLKASLDKTQGFKGNLIRQGNYYIPLTERSAAARQLRADLFVSIHADAFVQPSVRGASVFTLSDKAATSEMGRWLTSNENRSDLIGGVGAVSLADKNPMLQRVLMELSSQASQSESLKAGDAILAELGKVTTLHKARSEPAGFVVLKSLDVPSVLVETGFLSNPEEARLLSQPNHRRKISHAIYTGITKYLRANPPPGTYLAARAASKHTIRAGDTLSDLAERYGVSTQALREANRLSSDRIRVGKVLVIPRSAALGG